jgi:hypothetical protein
MPNESEHRARLRDQFDKSPVTQKEFADFCAGIFEMIEHLDHFMMFQVATMLHLIKGDPTTLMVEPTRTTMRENFMAFLNFRTFEIATRCFGMSEEDFIKSLKERATSNPQAAMGLAAYENKKLAVESLRKMVEDLWPTEPAK